MSSSTSAGWSRRAGRSPAVPVQWRSTPNASGHRYGQKAYLVQLRRAGSGTWLIDPMACPDSTCRRRHRRHRVGPPRGDAGPALSGPGRPEADEAVRHRARGPAGRSSPRRARRGGRALPRAVPGQGALGRRLVHPAPTRALAPVCRARRRGPRRAARRRRRGPRGPEQDTVGRGGVRRPARLRGPPIRVDPWRRTSGMHRIRKRRGLATVKELWLTRDRIAERRDTSPAGSCRTA